MLVNSSPYRIRTIMITISAAVLFGTMTQCGDRTCRSSRRSHSSMAHHHSACIRSDAFVTIKNQNVSVNQVFPGDMILMEDYKFVAVMSVKCHTGKFLLWKMPQLPPVTTPNHPIKINGQWVVGDWHSALMDFNIRATPMGVASTTYVDVVCSIETIAQDVVAIQVFFENRVLMIAD